MTCIIILICGLLGSAHARTADLPTPGPVINIVEWDTVHTHSRLRRPETRRRSDVKQIDVA